MIKNRKIERKEFDYLQNMPEYAVKGEDKHKKMKFTLLDDVIATMEDDWYKLGKDTKRTVDELCFIAIKRGYVYAKPETVGLKYGVAETTVYRVLKAMIKFGLLIKVSRKSKNHNGLGNAVYIFNKHPYSKHICEYLNLDAKAHSKAHDKAENTETPWESKTQSDNLALNLNLTSLLPEPKNNPNNHHNVSLEGCSGIITLSTAPIDINPTSEDAHVAKAKYMKFVPLKIYNQFFGSFKQNLLSLWRKIISAMKSVKLSDINREDILRVGDDTLRYLVNHKRYARMTLDEMCAYVYKGMRDGLYNMIGYQTLGEMEIISDEEAYYMNSDGNMVGTINRNTSNSRPVRLLKDYYSMDDDSFSHGFDDKKPKNKMAMLFENAFFNNNESEPVYQSAYNPKRNRIVVDSVVEGCLW